MVAAETSCEHYHHLASWHSSANRLDMHPVGHLINVLLIMLLVLSLSSSVCDWNMGLYICLMFLEFSPWQHLAAVTGDDAHSFTFLNSLDVELHGEESVVALLESLHLQNIGWSILYWAQYTLLSFHSAQAQYIMEYIALLLTISFSILMLRYN